MPALAFQGRVSTTALSPYQLADPNPYTRYWMAKTKKSRAPLALL